MNNDEKRKNRKKMIKRLLQAAVIIIAVLLAVNLCLTLFFTQKIPHRYASAQEGKALLRSNTDYYSNFTQNDLEFRMKKVGATMDELLDASTGEIRDYSFFEKYFIDHEIAKMAIKLLWNGYELPEIDKIVFIKTDMSVEMGNSGYTHGTQIYLNSGFVTINSILGIFPGFSKFFDELLWHEYFHCLSRCNPAFREKMYSLIHFTVADSDFELPPSVLERYISNPDVEHHDAYATFIIDGQQIDCFAAWITKTDYAQIPLGEDSDTEVVLVPIDGSDTYYTREQASNFDAVFGTNTGYVIDPEECMADNFAYAMFYGMKGKDGNGYPNPEIIQGVIDAVSRSLRKEAYSYHKVMQIQVRGGTLHENTVPVLHTNEYNERDHGKHCQNHRR